MNYAKRNQEYGQGGLGFSGALFLLFLALKLTHAVAWSWWWITAPLWIPLVLLILGAILFFVAYLTSRR